MSKVLGHSPKAKNSAFLALLLPVLTVAVVIAVYAPAWWSMVEIWSRSDTFTHGFLIAPISLWLIWRQRARLDWPRPSWRSLGWLGILAFGGLWLISDLIGIAMFTQFAAVGILISALWLALGPQLARQLLFPLLFLFFMVPVGERLIPYLIEFTADFTIAMLRLTGLTVFREGTHFTLVSGHWSVVEACSGLRYLIASLTLGTVYAYISYCSLQKRLLFVLFSIIVPVIANGFRAYIIVMIGHLSGMKLAVGVDHLVYGGVFFGLVMLILFYIGSFWSDVQLETPPEPELIGKYRHGFAFWPFLVAMAALIGFWPGVSAVLAGQTRLVTDLVEYPFDNNSLITSPDWGWRPKLTRSTQDRLDFVNQQSQVVGIYQAAFSDRNGQELVNSQNVLLSPGEAGWKIVKQSSLTLSDGATVRAATLTRLNKTLLVYRWYQLGGLTTPSDIKAKLMQLKKRLTLDQSSEKQMFIFTEVDPLAPEQAGHILDQLAVLLRTSL